MTDLAYISPCTQVVDGNYSAIFGSFRTLETGSAILITNLLQIATCYMFPAIQLT